MNDDNTGGGFGSEAKFRVFELIGATNSVFLTHLGGFARMAALPIALAVLLSLGAQWIAPLNVAEMTEADPFGGMNPADFWPHVMAGFVGFAILMSYTVSCHRLLLFDAAPSGVFGISFGPREIKFIGYTFLVAFIMVAFHLLASMPLAMLDGGGLGVGLAINITLMALLFVRLSLVFPAIAADAPGGLVGAWKLSTGHTVNLFGAYLALYIVFFLLMMVPSMLAAGTSVMLGGIGVMAIFNTVAQFISAAYFATMLSLAYKALTTA